MTGALRVAGAAEPVDELVEPEEPDDPDDEDELPPDPLDATVPPSTWT